MTAALAMLAAFVSSPGVSQPESCTFHCSFDDTLQPDVCAEGTQAAVEGEVRFVEGRSGKALFVEDGATVAFPTQGHINPREGTVALWVRPMPPEGRPKYARLFDMTSDAEPRSTVRLLHPNHTLLYAEMSVGGEKYIPWPMGDATVRGEDGQHLAVTWGPGGGTFYFNGVTLTATSEMPELQNLPDLFYVGSDASKAYAACAPIDDLYVFDRALRSHELFELAGRTSPTALDAGNWLANSSFELGPCPWQTYRWGASKGETRIDEGVGHPAGHSFLMDRSQEEQEWWSTVWLIGPWLHLQRSEEVTLSAWMRADRSDVQVQLDIQRGAEGRAVQGVADDAEPRAFHRIGTEWQRVMLTGTLPVSYKDGYRPRIALISKPCKLWIDDVQMALGPAREYVPLRQRELGLSSAEETTTYALGSEAHVLLHTQGGPARVAVTVTAPDGQERGETVEAAPESPVELSPIAIERPGHYVVSAEAGEASAMLTLAAIRDHSGTPSPKTSPFGTHGGGNEAARRLGLSQYRDVSGLTWRWIEREQGDWHYDDRLGVYAERIGLGFTNCGTLADAPPWAARPGGDLIPADLDEWRRYVRRIISDFREYVDIWEVWNEPDLKALFVEQPELYLQILEATREIQQEVHPAGKVAGLCAAGTEDRAFEWMESVMKLGAMEQMDLLAWHPYYHEQPEGGYYAALLRMNELMERYGGRKPMIFTEFGCAGVSDPSLHIPWAADGWRRYDEREQAAILVRQCVMALAQGAVKLYWYQWDEERIQTGPDTFGLVRADTHATPKLAAIAYSQLAWLLESATLPPKRLEPASGGYWSYLFATPGGEVTVVWDPAAKTTIVWPYRRKVIDLWGNEVPRADTLRLSQEPVYIVAE